MSTRFETASRFTPAGVTTASTLVVMLAMAASTLFTQDSSAPQATAGVGGTHVVQSQHSSHVRKS